MAHELTHSSTRAASSPRAASSSQAARMSLRMRDDTFERLYEENVRQVFYFLEYRTGNWALAEDLMSETFERAYHSRQRFDPRRGSERRWLYTIALNLLRDHARRQSHEELALEHVSAGAPDSFESDFDAVGHREELYRALATLRDDEREALALRFGADLKLRDIARILGEGESAVEGRIYRAMRKLHDKLD